MNYLNKIHDGAFKNVLSNKLGEFRKQSKNNEVASRPPQYVPPNKEKGKLTEKQVENNQDRERAVEIIAQNAKDAFFNLMPPPPDGQEMQSNLSNATETARKIYAKNPVKNPPYKSQVQEAYERAKIKSELYVFPVNLNEVYA